MDWFWTAGRYTCEVYDPSKRRRDVAKRYSSYLAINVTNLRTAHLVSPKVTRPKWTAQIRYDWMCSLNPGTSRSLDPLYKGSLSISFFSRYFLHLEFRRILFQLRYFPTLGGSTEIQKFSRAFILRKVSRKFHIRIRSTLQDFSVHLCATTNSEENDRFHQNEAKCSFPTLCVSRSKRG